MNGGTQTIAAGDELPPLALPPLSRTTCALFAGASGDHNPIHIDIDAAKAAGLPDVIGHGMLSMAMLGRLLTGWMPQAHLRSFTVRFQEPTLIGDAVTCAGRVLERTEAGQEVLIRVEISAVDQQGKIKTVGEATAALTIENENETP
ncbi:MaoC/PaaZ C-terminal domain-containing protein [Sphingomonas cavernae]|uniref:Dehydratase n=1 Tax=Sphingomonas cavernae TaxID=2320861 RepID=A0A418WQV4_9SPHN|nr:MaoC/PaaZ C-terminal domain-containing protein [Sphingomonas cavernae]RJF93622.1 dehydratase [Sphingomonas cavernae]